MAQVAIGLPPKSKGLSPRRGGILPLSGRPNGPAGRKAEMWSFRLETRHMSRRRSRAVHALIFALLLGGGVVALALLGAPAPATPAYPRAFFDTHCIGCHNQRLRTAGLALDSLDSAKPGANAEAWERVIEKLRAGSMPPPGLPRPDAATYHAVAGTLEIAIDRAWAANPNPGRISAVHRLNRAEYKNAIRDL